MRQHSGIGWIRAQNVQNEANTKGEVEVRDSSNSLPRDVPPFVHEASLMNAMVRRRRRVRRRSRQLRPTNVGVTRRREAMVDCHEPCQYHVRHTQCTRDDDHAAKACPFSQPQPCSSSRRCGARSYSSRRSARRHSTRSHSRRDRRCSHIQDRPRPVAEHVIAHVRECACLEDLSV